MWTNRKTQPVTEQHAAEDASTNEIYSSIRPAFHTLANIKIPRSSSGVGKSLLKMLDAKIPEFSEHRSACVQLQSQNSFSQNAIIAVREVHGQSAIHKVLNVVAFGDDNDIVPVIQPEQLLEFVGRDQWLI